eukprot:TRINITY_DN2189_c0_g1_i5.p1 TRINITY_DN2189_c0_g1~~TRINITY_DN2189_c0_g1_i5.p1  ORF type:complete len:242 (+),score=28.70 TRINITY_DN2189_c0_g1_i5:88-813(+)
MTEQVALVTETTTRYEQRYWIQHVNCSNCGLDNNYKVYKGEFPNDTSIVLDCAEAHPCLATASLPETLKFFAEGSPVGKFQCSPQASWCGQTTHRLTTPDIIGDRLLADVKSVAPFIAKQLSITASPYFKSIAGVKSYSKLIIIVLLVSIITFPILIMLSMRMINLMLVFNALMLICMVVLVVVIVKMLCKCITGSVKREKLLELVGIADNNKYADIYLSLIHICRCRRYAVCRSRWSPYH